MPIPFLNPLFFVWLLASALAGQAWAGHQDHTVLRGQAADWLKLQAGASFPGASAKVQVGEIDPRLQLDECGQAEFFLPTGARPWGTGSLGMRCGAPANWSLYVTYRIRLSGPALVARHALPARQALVPGDVVLSSQEYRGNPASYLQALPAGALLNRPIAAGQPVLLESLVAPTVIQAGRKVRIRVAGPGFAVSQEGIALNSAKIGEAVKIKTSSGRIVQGRAGQDGEVEIHP